MKITIPIHGSVTLECESYEIEDVFADLGIHHDDNTRLVDFQLEYTPDPLHTDRQPGDPDGLNDVRALWAYRTLALFMDLTGCDGETALPDLLCDLLHAVGVGGFEQALRTAREHYVAETAPDDRDDP